MKQVLQAEQEEKEKAGLAGLKPAPVCGQDINCFAFTAGQFEFQLIYPRSIEMPDNVMRLVKGICRQLEDLARQQTPK